MKSHMVATLGASALVLAGMLAVIGTTGGSALAGGPDDSERARVAAASAALAGKELGDGKVQSAVQHAEAAVAAQPQNAAYRALLGQAYLRSGRFASARDAYTDALVLAPNDGRSALALALAQVAGGDWSGARSTIDSHADLIPVADRGLAIALAGDPGLAVDILTVAARTPGADAKTRQNLALSLALAGRWSESRAVAELDVTPAELDKRMLEWAAFARPVGAADQVASLLGVTPVVDQGQPVALALNARVAPKGVATVAQPAPAAVAVAAPPVVEQPAPAPAPAAVAAVESAPRPGIVFGERREVVQPLPAPATAKVQPVAVAAKRAPVAVATAPAKTRPVIAIAASVPVAPRAKGNFYLQLGAFENAAVAQDGWKRAVRRYAAFAGHQPTGMDYKSDAGSFYRLSVGGFNRADAVSMCLAYRARGGSCFVREGAGDSAAQWLQPKAKVAAPAVAAKPAPGAAKLVKPAAVVKPAADHAKAPMGAKPVAKPVPAKH